MTATLIGATGLIGGYLLDELLNDDYFTRVRILVRRPYFREGQEFTHPKLEKKLVDFSDPESFRLALEDSQVIFCAVGTTQKKVKGDKAAYRKVDFDIPVHAARYGKLCGCEQFVLVSSVGASNQSGNFYLKLKGETEEAVQSVGLRSVHLMRPSMLLGERKEFRLGEKLSKGLMKGLTFLFPSKYKPVHGRDVARAMIAAAKKGGTGTFTYEFKDIKKILT